MDSTINTNQSYELLKIILEFIGIISWPLIIMILVLVFKSEIKKFLSKAKKVILPGGFSFEVEEDIKQMEDLKSKIEFERKPETKESLRKDLKTLETEANKKMLELGLNPSPSGLDINYYKKIAESDPRLALIGLRTDFEMMIKNLAIGFKIPNSEKEPISSLISKLYEKKALTKNQYDFIKIVFRISNAAVHGAYFTEDQAFEVLEIAKVLIEDYIAWLDWGFPNK